LVESDGEDDHVSLLVNYTPKLSAPNRVNGLKAVSSWMIKEDFPSIRKKLWGWPTAVAVLLRPQLSASAQCSPGSISSSSARRN
jgi:REP element-mobilizing transposase RayT